MPVEIKMPKLGLTMTEGTVAQWLKAEGDMVVKGDPIFVMETDKITLEVESQVSGVLSQILAPEGTTVPVLQAVALVSEEGEPLPAAKVSRVSEPEVAPEGATQVTTALKASAESPASSLGIRATPKARRLAATADLDLGTIQGSGPGGRILTEDVERALAESAVPTMTATARETALPSVEVKASPKARRLAEKAGLDLISIAGTGPQGRVMAEDVQRALAERETASMAPAVSEPSPVQTKVRISPMASRLAEDAGLDLATLKGSGPGGRIMREDVEGAIAQSVAPAIAQQTAELGYAPEAPVPPSPPVTVIPMTGVRGVIARHMADSAHTTASVTSTTEVDATELVRLREGLREEWQATVGFAPSYNDLLVVILAKALREYPYMNAHIVGDEIHLLPAINVGIAVDTDRGLVVPVIKDVEGMNLAKVVSASRDLVERARATKLLPDELNGGTFTVSNMGMFDVDVSTPIINLPECAILGVGRIAPRPFALDGELCIRKTMILSLTYDHRAIDGAPAARFLTRLKYLIERPYLAFFAAEPRRE